MTVAATVSDYLLDRGIDYEVLPHPLTYSSREAAGAARIPGDHIAKAVIVEDPQGAVMAVIPGSHWLKLDALRHQLAREVNLAPEADVDDLFADCEPGAIPPLGPAYGLPTVLDEALASLAEVYFEGGDHESLIRVSGEDFLALLPGVRHGHFSHE